MGTSISFKMLIFCSISQILLFHVVQYDLIHLSFLHLIGSSPPIFVFYKYAISTHVLSKVRMAKWAQEISDIFHDRYSPGEMYTHQIVSYGFCFGSYLLCLLLVTEFF